MGAGIPLYVHPGVSGPPWATLASAGAPVDFVVLNQASGPGSSEDAVLGDAARSVQTVGGYPIVAYIDHNYAATVDFTVFANADTWVSRGFKNFFLDRVSTDPSKIQALTVTLQGLRKRGGAGNRIVLNFGTIPDEGHIPLADVSVIFEGDLATWKAWTPPSWLSRYPASKFAIMVHGVASAADAQKVVADCSRIGIRTAFCYPTTAYDGLPAYWPELSKQLAKENPGVLL
jgi:hypothetical protein